jgi:prefoldin subunit 5
MSDSLFDQLRTRGEGFITEISNNLMANPTFIEVLKKGIAVKEEVDKRVLEALKTMSVATRKDLAKMEKRLEELQAELDSLKAKATSKPRARKASGRKG